MLVISNVNLLLNFKPENKTYRFSKGGRYDVTQAVLNYLKLKYKDSFTEIFDTPVVIKNQNENNDTPVAVVVESDNLLNQLIEVENRNEPFDIKKTIEKAIDQQIIIKQGSIYKFEDKACKGLIKVKELLEKDEVTLQKIIKKLK